MYRFRYDEQPPKRHYKIGGSGGIIITIIIIIMRKFSYTRTLNLWTYLQIQVERYTYVAEIQVSNNFLVYLIGWLVSTQTTLSYGRCTFAGWGGRDESWSFTTKWKYIRSYAGSSQGPIIVFLVPKWSGSESLVFLEEFLLVSNQHPEQGTGRVEIILR